MLPRRPYLLRAFYEWVVDNDFTPHIVVNADDEAAVVPREFVEDGQIVLNISPASVRGLSLGNDFVHFNARFRGQAMDVHVPIRAVLAIYARENGEGMVFPDEDFDDDPPPPPPEDSPTDSGNDGPAKRPSLRVVK